MTLRNYKIYINKDDPDELTYERESKISKIKIITSDESLYQTAEILLYGVSQDDLNDITINSTIEIEINGNVEFSGYIVRIRRSVKGTLIIHLQCVGKTYNLWRYVTPSKLVYTDTLTGDIVSDLVNTYCSGNYNITADIPANTGEYIEEIDLSNLEIGKCISKLIKMDGYHFYVDEDDVFHYYQPQDSTTVTITDSDIIDMSPVEQSDDSLYNDIMVIGSKKFENESKKDKAPNDYYKISTNTTLVAQKIYVPDNLDNNWLSAISFYVDSSRGGETPVYLSGDIRDNYNNEPSSSYLPSSNEINWEGGVLTNPPNWIPYYYLNDYDSLNLVGGNSYWITLKYDGADADSYWKIAYYSMSGQAGEDYNYDEGSMVLNNEENWDTNTIDYGYVSGHTSDAIYFESLIKGDNTSDSFISSQYRWASTDTTPYIYNDEVYFQISTQINKWSISGGTYAVDDYEKYKPKFSIHYIDSTKGSDDGHSPGIGVDFDLSSRMYTLFASDTMNAGYLYDISGVLLSGRLDFLEEIFDVYVEPAGNGYFLARQPFNEYHLYAWKEDFVGNNLEYNTWCDGKLWDALFDPNDASKAYILSRREQLGYTYYVKNIEQVYYDNPTIIWQYDSNVDSTSTYGSGKLLIDPSGVHLYYCYIDQGSPLSESKLVISKINQSNGTLASNFGTGGKAEFDWGNKTLYNRNRSVCVDWDGNIYFSHSGSKINKVLGSDGTLAWEDKGTNENVLAWNYDRNVLYSAGDGDSSSHKYSRIKIYDSDGNLNNSEDIYWLSGTSLGERRIGHMTINYDNSITATTKGGKYLLHFSESGLSTLSAVPIYPYSGSEETTDINMLSIYHKKRIRPSVSVGLLENNQTGREYYSGDWIGTGSSYIRCDLVGGLLTLSNDKSESSDLTLSDKVLYGNYKFGTGYNYSWSSLRFSMVDGKANTNQDNRNDTLISGLLNSIKVGIPNQTNVAISHDDGANWNVNTNRSSIFKVGWNYNNVRGRDSDNSSIKTYGRHFKKINEPLLTTNEDCENYANRYLSVYKDGIDKGSIVVRNKPDLDITSKFRLSSNTMGIDDVYSVVEYTQTIDQNGYNTSISYGESPYNIAQEVARLKSKVD